jgi:hypothetical protein
MKTVRMKFLRLLAPLGALLIAVLACGSPTMLTTVNLHPEDLNRLTQGMVVEDPAQGWLFQVQRVELLDGLLRVYGEYQPQDGEVTEGSLDVTMSVVEDEFRVEVVGVNMTGTALGDDWLNSLNDELARLITETTGKDRTGVKIVSVKITPEAVQVGLRYLP